MGKNSTKAEKAKRNLEYAMAHKKRVAPTRRFGRPASSPMTSAPMGTTGEQGVSTGSVPQRPMFPAVCTTCGTATTVPFEPTAGKPVQCRNCYQPRARS